ncbi:protein of unknown function (plasmid) [Rhodovastum atsumiense]|nr:protein of unknown function [Rhodovastum atsumiense]
MVQAGRTQSTHPAYPEYALALWISGCSSRQDCELWNHSGKCFKNLHFSRRVIHSICG